MRFLKLNKLNALQHNRLWETLIEEKKKGLIPETIVFSSSSTFAWAGKWVPPEEIRNYINIDFCKANNIPVLWEPLMGGAYFFPDGSWNCWLIVDMKAEIGLFSMKLWANFLNSIKNGLEQLGVKDVSIDKNNIMIGTKKASGATITHYGNKAVGIEASVNVDFDYALANQVLTALGRGNKVLSDTTISLNELGLNLSYNDLNPIFKSAIERQFNIKLEESQLTEAEKAAVGLV